MEVDLSSDSTKSTTESTERFMLPSPLHHWYIARGVLQWSRAGRRGRQLYEERLVLIDAPTPAKAIDVARKEAKRGCLKGQNSVDILDLMLPAQHRGHELCRSEYRSTESPDTFVARRFESGTRHAMKDKNNGSGRSDDAAGTEPVKHYQDPGVVVVRCLHRSGRLRLGGGKPAYLWIERFCAYVTNDFGEALQWAENDDEAFAHASGLETYPLWEAYKLWEPVGDRAELFSILRESKKSSRKFMKQITTNTA